MRTVERVEDPKDTFRPGSSQLQVLKADIFTGITNAQGSSVGGLY